MRQTKTELEDMNYPLKTEGARVVSPKVKTLARAYAWQTERKIERDMRERFCKSLDLPFKAEYGVHRVHKGDIFAFVVHEDWRDMRSPFRVKYCTIGKIGDHWATYESDADGNMLEGKGRALIGNKLMGYLKVG